MLFSPVLLVDFVISSFERNIFKCIIEGGDELIDESSCGAGDIHLICLIRVSNSILSHFGSTTQTHEMESATGLQR